jgi:hypothetical protein
VNEQSVTYEEILEKLASVGLSVEPEPEGVVAVPVRPGPCQDSTCPEGYASAASSSGAPSV